MILLYIRYKMNYRYMLKCNSNYLTMHDIYLKGFAEAIIPYLIPYIENKVKDEFLNIQTPKQGSPELLTKKQVMAKYQISAMTLWRMEQKGTLVPVRIGNKVMYYPKDVEKLFK